MIKGYVPRTGGKDTERLMVKVRRRRETEIRNIKDKMNKIWRTEQRSVVSKNKTKQKKKATKRSK